MPKKEVTKCKNCGSYRCPDEVVLDKTDWEYVCRDQLRCQNARLKETVRKREYRRKRRIA